MERAEAGGGVEGRTSLILGACGGCTETRIFALVFAASNTLFCGAFFVLNATDWLVFVILVMAFS